MTVITDKNTYSCQTNASASCSISQSSGQYTDGSVIDIEITKVCPASMVVENVTYTVDGHL
jgi:hypothetical protein